MNTNRWQHHRRGNTMDFVRQAQREELGQQLQALDYAKAATSAESRSVDSVRTAMDERLRVAFGIIDDDEALPFDAASDVTPENRDDYADLLDTQMAAIF